MKLTVVPANPGIQTRILACLITLMLAAGISGGQAKDPNLFPTGKGSEWTFKGSAGTTPLEIRAEITSSTATAGKKSVDVKWTLAGRETQTETYIVSATQVARARSGSGATSVIEPPIPVIKYPLKIGSSWHWDGTITQGPANNRMTLNANSDLKLAGRDKIKVGTKEVDAYRVEMSLTIKAQGQSMTIPNTYWFGPDLGLIKQSSDLAQGAQKIHVEAVVTDYKIK